MCVKKRFLESHKQVFVFELYPDRYNSEKSRGENTTEIQLLQLGYNFAGVVPIVSESCIRFLLGY